MLGVVTVNVIMLSLIILNAVMLGAIMLSAVALKLASHIFNYKNLKILMKIFCRLQQRGGSFVYPL